MAAVAGLRAVYRARVAVAATRSATRDGAARSRAHRTALVQRLPGGTRLARRIKRSGMHLSPDAFVLAAMGASMVSAFALLLVFRAPLPAAAGLAVGPAGARAALGAADRRHLRRVSDAMPAVAQMLAGAVAAGLSLRQAIVRAARDTPDPLGAELRRAASDMELGARVDDALAGLAARLPDADLGLLVTAILVQRRTGGDLARALRDMSARLEERGRLARELRGATAQARATAWMVAALPILAAALAESASPGLIARTASSPIGIAVLSMSVLLQVAGIVLIRRIAAVRS